jgi:hypothetical protein
MPHDTITGTFAAVRDFGSLVLVFLDGGDGRLVPVPMDRRAFRHLIEAAACHPDELMGRGISFDGELVTLRERGPNDAPCGEVPPGPAGGDPRRPGGERPC